MSWDAIYVKSFLPTSYQTWKIWHTIWGTNTNWNTGITDPSNWRFMKLGQALEALVGTGSRSMFLYSDVGWKIRGGQLSQWFAAQGGVSISQGRHRHYQDTSFRDNRWSGQFLIRKYDTHLSCQTNMKGGSFTRFRPDDQSGNGIIQVSKREDGGDCPTLAEAFAAWREEVKEPWNAKLCERKLNDIFGESISTFPDTFVAYFRSPLVFGTTKEKRTRGKDVLTIIRLGTERSAKATQETKTMMTDLLLDAGSGETKNAM